MKVNKYWARFFWDLGHLFSKTLNPYVLHGEDDLDPVERTALQDIGHAFKNLWAHTPSK